MVDVGAAGARVPVVGADVGDGGAAGPARADRAIVERAPVAGFDDVDRMDREARPGRRLLAVEPPRGPLPNIQDMLWNAAKRGDTMAISQAINKGADPTATDDDFHDCTALHYAAMKGQTDAVRALIEADPEGSVNPLDSRGWTPMTYAGFAGFEQTCDVLREL